MKIQSDVFKVIVDPDPALCRMTPIEWLKKYQQPICICLTGEDTSQTRVVSTLLHGNEPSGLAAMIHWLGKGQKPAVNIICFISAIHAALREPYFTHRTAESDIDLNRVFKNYSDSPESKIAAEILRILKQIEPQCLVDIHNTSGSSPAYAVITKESLENKQLSSLFINECIVFNIKLGTLVETVATDYPCVVIECGGAKDPRSRLRAEQGIEQYFMAPDLSLLNTQNLVVRKDPIRVELKKGYILGYGDTLLEGCDVVFPLDADKFNSEVLVKDGMLAWVRSSEVEMFNFANVAETIIMSDYFYIEGNRLFAKQDLRLYMVTTNIEVANSDCLFYLIPSHD